jgi:hypothetical protein
MPRKNLTPTQNSRVCIKHFHKDNIIIHENYQNKDEEIRTVKRDKPILNENAIPKIFLNLPNYLSDNRK